MGAWCRTHEGDAWNHGDLARRSTGFVPLTNLVRRVVTHVTRGAVGGSLI